MGKLECYRQTKPFFKTPTIFSVHMLMLNWSSFYVNRIGSRNRVAISVLSGIKKEDSTSYLNVTRNRKIGER